MVTQVPGGEHYFSARPGSAPERRTVQVHLAGRALEVVTAAGVFSPGRVDLGTEVLLRSVPAPPATGDLLDLGCGWGPIALTLALRSPAARVWAVDVNERALDLVRGNADQHGLTNVRATLPQDVPDELAFAAIWANPPIRIGKPALHALLGAWLPRLAPGAAAHLVVQRNLGADSLHAWLAAQWPGRLDVARTASAKGFRVLAVTAVGRPGGSDGDPGPRSGGRARSRPIRSDLGWGHPVRPTERPAPTEESP